MSAQPFVPGASSGAASGRQPVLSGTAKPPKPSPSKVGRGSRPGSKPGGRPSTPDLPEGDDLLGLSAVSSGDARDMAAQAAEMFRSLNPFPTQQAAQGAPGTGGRSGRGGSARSSPRPGSAQGLGPPPPGFGPTTAAAAAAASSQMQPAAGVAGTAAVPSSSSAAGGGGGWPAQSAGPPHASSSTRGGGGGRGGGRGRGRRPGNTRASSSYSTAPGRMQKSGLFMSEQLRQELQQRSYLIQASPGQFTHPCSQRRVRTLTSQAPLKQRARLAAAG